MRMMENGALALITLVLTSMARLVLADEFPAGEPVEKSGLEIAGVYLQAVEMEPAMSGQEPGETDIHLEADIHATDGNSHGFAEGDWIPYLVIDYTLGKGGSDWTKSGMLHPMIASDGPHYGANVALDGPGLYRVSFRIHPPAGDHFMRHTDKETGIAPWWNTIDYAGDFKFIGTGKKGDY